MFNKRFCPEKLELDYYLMWESTVVKRLSASKYVSDILIINANRYKEVASVTSVPWQIIACIHSLESYMDFSKCLHNGQPFNQMTTWVPKGLGPWDSWEEAAIDALQRKKLPKAWTIENTLYFLEKYNGLGYRKYHPRIRSPYLWSGTNHYTRGKYTSDGKFSTTAISKQIGAVCILKLLKYVYVS